MFAQKFHLKVMYLIRNPKYHYRFEPSLSLPPQQTLIGRRTKDGSLNLKRALVRNVNRLSFSLSSKSSLFTDDRLDISSRVKHTPSPPV